MTPSRTSGMEWSDDDGQRVVVNDGRLSVYGKPSMTSDTGQVAVGADVPTTVCVVPVEDLAANELAHCQEAARLRTRIEGLQDECNRWARRWAAQGLGEPQP